MKHEKPRSQISQRTQLSMGPALCPGRGGRGRGQDTHLSPSDILWKPQQVQR